MLPAYASLWIIPITTRFRICPRKRLSFLKLLMFSNHKTFTFLYKANNLRVCDVDYTWCLYVITCTSSVSKYFLYNEIIVIVKATLKESSVNLSRAPFNVFKLQGSTFRQINSVFLVNFQEYFRSSVCHFLLLHSLHPTISRKFKTFLLSPSEFKLHCRFFCWNYEQMEYPLSVLVRHRVIHFFSPCIRHW